MRNGRWITRACDKTTTLQKMLVGHPSETRTVSGLVRSRRRDANTSVVHNSAPITTGGTSGGAPVAFITYHARVLNSMRVYNNLCLHS